MLIYGLMVHTTKMKELKGEGESKMRAMLFKRRILLLSNECQPKHAKEELCMEPKY